MLNLRGKMTDGATTEIFEFLNQLKSHLFSSLLSHKLTLRSGGDHYENHLDR